MAYYPRTHFTKQYSLPPSNKTLRSILLSHIYSQNQNNAIQNKYQIKVDKKLLKVIQLLNQIIDNDDQSEGDSLNPLDSFDGQENNDNFEENEIKSI